jgi:hypothetical protein
VRLVRSGVRRGLVWLPGMRVLLVRRGNMRVGDAFVIGDGWDFY